MNGTTAIAIRTASRTFPGVLLLVLMLAAGGCGGDSADRRNGDNGTSILVGAAASLKNAFDEIGRAFQNNRPGVTVRFNYAGSNKIARQVRSGAPFDVIALAEESLAARLDSNGFLEPASLSTFARNRLCVAVGRSVPLVPSTLEDLLSRDYHHVAIASPGVPARIYAEQALRNAGLWNSLESRFVYGANVRQVLSYVATGEAECGLVYTSDVAAVPGTTVALVVDSTLHAPIRYPVAIVRETRARAEASGFVAFLTSPEAVRILRKYGFLPS